jgi:hypothetical protein
MFAHGLPAASTTTTASATTAAASTAAAAASAAATTEKEAVAERQKGEQSKQEQGKVTATHFQGKEAAIVSNRGEMTGRPLFGFFYSRKPPLLG